MIKKLIVIFFICIMILPVFATEKTFVGNWMGTLKVPGAELRVVFKIKQDDQGKFTATLDSIDQGANDIPVTSVKIDGNKIELLLSMLNGDFKGEADEEMKVIKGIWSQNKVDFPLELERTKTEIKLNRPQEPQKPYPYLEEEVSYRNEKAGLNIVGTLTKPKEKGPFPVVLLITGSGAQDRDETVFGHRPFLVLADYLTRRGIAVLRVDDRGVGGSQGNIKDSTTMDFAGDVLAGVEYLKSRKDIDLKNIGLVGHSEGGVIAPIVAAKSKDIAFIVLMAGTGLTGEDIILKQTRLIMLASKVPEETISKELQNLERAFQIVKKNDNPQKAEQEMMEIYKDEIEKEGKDFKDKKIQDELKAQISSANSRWFRFFIKYDPKEYLVKVKCPVLALNGEMDLQVPPRENLEAIGQYLKAAGNEQVTITLIPGLNHLFQKSETGSPSEYSKIEETISPDALKIIGDWIVKQVK